MNLKSKFKKSVKKTLAILMSAFTLASVVTVPCMTETVNASSSLDMATAFSQVVGSHAGKGSWHYSYSGGNNFGTIMSDGMPSADTYYNIGLDCSAGTLALVSRAVVNAGGNPRDYFGQCDGQLNNVGVATLKNYFTNMSLVYTDIVDASQLEVGDILVFGNAHMSVYAGNGQTYDFTSGGAGTQTYKGWATTLNYTGSAGSGTTTSPLNAVYRITLNKNISVSVTKSSTLPDCTNGNSLYGLGGATFGVYTSSDASESSRIATITTDDSGNGSANNIEVSSNVNTVYVKEIDAPANYTISDTSIHTVDVSSGSGNASFSDRPINDPAYITLNKVDSEGKQNIASLEGAEFTINYYDTFDNVDGRTPTRTWVIKSIAEQHADGSTWYVAQLDDTHLVSGTLYKDESNMTIIPLGTITVEETKAPNEYTTDGGYMKVNGEEYSATSKMTFQIVNENSSAVIHAGNVFTKKEDSIRGGYKVVKEDYSTGTTPEGNATLAGAEFDLFYLGDGTDATVGMKIDTDGDGLGDSVEYLPSETTPIDHITIGQDGTYNSSNTYLGYGKYKLVETKSGNGYLTTSYDGTQVSKEFTVSSDETVVEFPVDNYPFLGGFTLQKNDDELKEAYAQGDANLKTTFEIVNASANPVTVLGKTYAVGEAIDIEGKGERTFTTDGNGYYRSAEKLLPFGTYTINEVNVPEGYTTDGTTSTTFDITEHGQMVDQTFKIFNQPIRGGFNIQKNDKEYDTRSQGDTNLQTTFELYNRSTYDVLVDVNGDGKLDTTSERFAPNALITTFTTNEAGYYETTSDYLPYGTYEVTEKTQPTGYTHNASDKDGILTKTFSVREDSTIVDLTYEIFNRVDYGKFEIYKVAANSTSDWATPEEGVEFTAILSSKIGEGKEYATFEDAYNAIKANANADGDVKDGDRYVLTKHEYAVITTGADGKATSNDLAYGTYTIKQTSHVEDTQDVTNEATFVVKEDGQATVSYTATNTPMKYRLHMIKVDADTQKTVTLNSAEFKIFQLTDRQGKEVNEYVKQKVGLFTYDTFKTNSDNNGLVVFDTFTGVYTDHNDNSGAVTTPLELESGTYRIDEIKTPEGYLQLEEPIEFEIKESTITRRDDDDDAIIEVEVENNKPHGALVINKQLENYDYDQSLLREGFDYSTIKFELRANEDIIDPADGSVITAKGDLANNVYYEEVGAITLDEDGYAEITDLPMGSYTLEETEVPEGVVRDETIHDVTFTQEDDEAQHKNYVVTFYDDYSEATNWGEGDIPEDTKVQTGNDTIINKVTKLEVSKKKVTGDDELAGATLSIKDSNGNVVTDKDGNDLTWVSGTKEHKVEGLHIGEIYQLEETIQAEGYVKATTIPFTVNEDGSVTSVTMIDKVFSASKVDVAGEEVKGAEMTVTDKDGNIVDQWISDGTEHRINNLEENKTYTISETVTADGYVKATDITFTVKGADENGKKEDEHIDVVDKMVTTSKVDMGGKEVVGAEMSVTDKDGNIVDTWTSDGTEHKIQNLEENKTYTLHEVVTPEGYVKATDIEFTVTGEDEKGVKVDQTVDMTDKRVSIDKTDGNGNEVEGAKITITDEDGNTVDEWTSTNEKHYVNNLEEGKTYTWHEDYSEEIFGYYYAEDYTFTVTADGIDQELEMVDAPIQYQIAKVDDNGKYVKGVTLELTDVTDKNNPTKVELPNDGVTTDKPFELNKVLGAEHTYELVESEYVGGVYKATKMQFTVPKYGTSKVTTITMEDTLTNVSVAKIDNHGDRVEGAKMSILEATVNEDGTITPALDENGEEKAPIYTFTSTKKNEDISQYVKGSNEESGDVWYILREDEAPFGFEKTVDQPFKVTGTNEEHQVLVAIDSRKQYYVSAIKVDSQDENKKLKGAELTLYTADGEVAKETSGKEAKGLTDGQGNITWIVEYNGDGTTDTLTGYYVLETNAPQGYKINIDKHSVTLSKDYDFSNTHPIKITIADEMIPAVPDTSDTNNLIFYAGLLLLATGTFFLFKQTRNKQ